MKRRFWTAEEERVLRELYPHKATKEVAARIGRTERQVYQHADKMGLKKTQEYLDSPAACRLRRGDNVGVVFRFKRGQQPHNKGFRRPGWAPGRMAETQFKSGNRTGKAAENWRPVGTKRVDAEGYWRIKVREAKPGENYGFGNVRVWPLLHRWNWQKAHGEIPKGHILVFRDKDRANCDVSNLELITLAENMRRNTYHRYPKEIAQAIQLVGALQRQINKRARDGKEHDARPA